VGARYELARDGRPQGLVRAATEPLSVSRLCIILVSHPRVLPQRYYNHPNDKLFSNFTEWFEFLKSKKLRTYFNDHRPTYPSEPRTPCRPV
jgi:hypothetical protein